MYCAAGGDLTVKDQGGISCDGMSRNLINQKTYNEIYCVYMAESRRALAQQRPTRANPLALHRRWRRGGRVRDLWSERHAKHAFASEQQLREGWKGGGGVRGW